MQDYISNTITEIDERIKECEDMLSFLRKQREAAVVFKPQIKKYTATEKKSWFYTVDSRSGGQQHLIQRDEDGVYKCTCMAALSGRTCWARKGVEYDTQINSNNVSRNIGRPWNGYFYSEGIKHSYKWSQNSWYDANRS